MRCIRLTLIFLLFSQLTQAEDFHCFVVSGIKHDDNHAFGDSFQLLWPGRNNSKIGNQACRVFGGWTDLKHHIELGQKNRSYKLGAQLLIIQGAHGSAEGFACNTERPSQDDVYSTLASFAENFKVGAVIDSCFSGQLMKFKLGRDTEKTIDNLCLLTSSTPGSVAKNVEVDFNSTDLNWLKKQLEKRDYNLLRKDESHYDLLDVIRLLRFGAHLNLEEIFLKSAPGGLISSAPFSLLSKDNVFQLKQKKIRELAFKKMIVGSFSCRDGADQASNEALEICRNEKLNDELVRDAQLIYLFDEKEFKEDADKLRAAIGKFPKQDPYRALLKRTRSDCEFVLSVRSQTKKDHITNDWVEWLAHSCDAKSRIFKYTNKTVADIQKVGSLELIREILASKKYQPSAECKSERQDIFDAVLSGEDSRLNLDTTDPKQPAFGSLFTAWVRESLKIEPLTDSVDIRRRNACRNFVLSVK